MFEQRLVLAHVLTALFVVPALPLRSVAQASPPGSIAATKTASTTPFVGCYELKMGRWWPWGFGEDNSFVTPPSRIQLLSLGGTEGFEKDGFIIRTLPESNRAMHGIRTVWSYWRVTSPNDVDLVWTDGLTGVTLRLHKSGDDLVGWAHPHFDTPSLLRAAHVTARKELCNERDEAPPTR